MSANEFTVVGYLLIEGKARAEYMHPSIPDLIFTPTTCVCIIHPSPEAVTWMSHQSSYLADLRFNDDQLAKYCAEVDELFYRRLWGFDAIFSNLETAQSFKKKWFKDAQNIRLVEIAIPRDLLTEFTEAVAPPEKNAAQNGSYLASLMIQSSDFQIGLGYEVVGVTAWSDMHTSVCYSVRDRFIQEFDAKFNTAGLFDSLGDARLAADMNNNADGGAVGDAFWFPVRISHVDSAPENCK